MILPIDKIYNMSNIVFETSNSMIIVGNYKEILQNTISLVCKKINFDDKDVKWVIFDPKQGKSTSERLFVGRKGADYGYTNIQEQTIYISILAIQASEQIYGKKWNVRMRLGKIRNDFLSNVIIDEITHIQTKKNHGMEEYDKKLQENMDIFYLSLIDRMQGKHKLLS